MLQQLFAALSSRPILNNDNAGMQGVPVRHLYQAATVALARNAERPLRILEIGSWIGSSALTWGQALTVLSPMKGMLVCIDPWEPYFGQEDLTRGAVYRNMDRISRADISYELFRYNVSFIESGVDVITIRGKSSLASLNVRRNYYDIVYIDGSHYYEDVLEDLRIAKDLVVDGGIICGDDLELQWHECDKEQVGGLGRLDFLEAAGGRPSFHPGVTRAVGEFFGGAVVAHCGYWLMRKSGTGYERPSLAQQPTILPNHFPHDVQMQCRIAHLNSSLGEFVGDSSDNGSTARAFGNWMILACRNAPLAIWGAGTDFLRIVAQVPEILAAISAGRIRLVDQSPVPALAELSLSTETPDKLRDFHGNVAITARSAPTVAAVRATAFSYGLVDAQLMDFESFLSN